MEYKFGIDGNKPAEQFTSKERNNVAGGIKQRYYCRRVVWNCIERLINQTLLFGPRPQRFHKNLQVL
jgi:hypothetical protein